MYIHCIYMYTCIYTHRKDDPSSHKNVLHSGYYNVCTCTTYITSIIHVQYM